jgi:hypothetical protein
MPGIGESLLFAWGLLRWFGICDEVRVGQRWLHPGRPPAEIGHRGEIADVVVASQVAQNG